MPSQQFVKQPSEQQVPTNTCSRWLDLAALMLALGCGCWFWLAFFDYGRLTLSFEDWPMHGYYLDVFRESLTKFQIPWAVNWWPQGTDKFLAVPETPLSPLLFLLPWLSNGLVIALHIALVYGIGVWGWWTLKRNMGWSREAFLLVVTLSSFNGYIVSRMAVGHFIWCGYFLSPWLLLGLQKILLSDGSKRAWPPLAFGLFALFFLGSFHMAIWWIFLIGFAALAKPKALVPAFLAIVCGCLMAAFRIIPAVRFLHEKSAFLTGYPNLKTLLGAFTQSQDYVSVTPGGEWAASRVGWWEFDHYVGWPALLFVLVFAAITLVFWRKNNPVAVPLAVASVALGVLSYGDVYACFFNLPLSVFHSERISSRFIEVSFLALLLVAVSGLERAPVLRRLSRLFCAVFLAVVVFDLWGAAQLWMLPRLETSHPFSWYFPELQTLRPTLVTQPHQARYHAIVLGSWIVSLVAIGSVALLAEKKRGNSQRAKNES